MPKVPKLTDDEVHSALAGLPGWTRVGEEIVRTYELDSFRAAVDFVVRIADLAEAADHHPDLDLRYRKVRVSLTTHDSGGLSGKDVELAARIDATAGD